MKVAMFGTFDVGNFGDLLFPIVAEKKLMQLTNVELSRYSYRNLTNTNWCYDVEAIQVFPDRVSEYDLVLIGGGHLIHFNKLMASKYHPTDKSIPHPLGFWWLPALFGKLSGLPVVLHGVSTDPQFPRWATPLMEAFVASLDYATVRDKHSQERLVRFADAGQAIDLVPDSIFSIADILSRGEYSKKYLEFVKVCKLTDKYLIIQPSYALRNFKDEIISLARYAVEYGWTVLELPIGYGIGNDIGYYEDFVGLRRITDWPEPLLLAEIIANAEAVAGVSLHLSVVASSYGIPVFRPEIKKGSKFELLRGLPNLRFFGSNAKLVGRGDAAPNLELVDQFRKRLDSHWRQIIDVASQPKRVVKSRGWRQLCATPTMFLASRTLTERIRDIKKDAIRKRQLVTHRLRQQFAR